MIKSKITRENKALWSFLDTISCEKENSSGILGTLSLKVWFSQ